MQSRLESMLVLYYVHKAESIVEFPPNLGDGTDDTDDGDDDGTDDAGAQPPASSRCAQLAVFSRPP